MQGRLLPPVNEQLQAFPLVWWEREFRLARELGLKCIEWVYDQYYIDNPLTTWEGAVFIPTLPERYGVYVDSLCADYFVKYPLLRASNDVIATRLRHLSWLMGQCEIAGITRLVLPFVDNSAINTRDEIDEVVRNVGAILHRAKHCGITIHLETNLAPIPFADLLYRLEVLANYDTGNSASLGYNPDEEWDTYGDKIGSIHIKDRLLNGLSVPLGEGNVDWDKQFSNMKRYGYSGDLILQVQRGKDNDEMAWAMKNISFVKEYPPNA